MRRALAVGVTTIALAMGAACAHAAFPGENGRIAFIRTEIGHFVDGPFQTNFSIAVDVFSMAPDGTGATNLTPSLPSVLRPAWSPGGDRLAFDVEREGILVMNADGSGVRHVPNTGPGDHDPAWAPDGRTLAFTRARGGAYDIYAVDVDGRGLRLLAHEGRNGGAAWSPDGTAIAFESDRVRGPYLYVMSANGTDQRRLTDSRLGECCPDWSPDGKRITFDGAAEIHVAHADGSGDVAITDHPRVDRDPVWSPDGSKIAFATFRDGTPVIYTMNPDGTALTKLTGTVDMWDTYPTWQPLLPQRSSYRNPAHFCKATRDLLGDGAFEARFGGGANAFGKCVSADA